MQVDLASVVQGDKRVLSFMSQAIGLMSEVDLGTESLRFMGDRSVQSFRVLCRGTSLISLE